jgi:2-(1,2-epoxy-1,2-dihydrophenyl)acetyl-CoA isomerase
MADEGLKSEPDLLVETHEAVRILRLNRPHKKNALSDKLVVDLVREFREAARDDDVRAVGITGQGGAFSSGADLGGGNPAAGANGPNRNLDDLGAIGRLVMGMRIECDKPVIAGVDGIAIGAGLSVAMCADIRIASSAARFHPGYSRAGTSPDGGLSWTLPQAVGHERAMRFLLEQEMLDADQALAIGLVGEVVAVDDFEAAFVGYCQKIAEVAPTAARQTKRLVARVGLPPDLESQLRDEITYAVRALKSPDGQEAIRAIIEKRKPQF